MLVCSWPDQLLFIMSIKKEEGKRRNKKKMKRNLKVIYKTVFTLNTRKIFLTISAV